MKKVFITGGDGYIGHKIAMQYINENKLKVLLWVKASNADEIAQKIVRLKSLYQEDLKNISLYWGDLCSATPFQGIETKDIVEIIHTAAKIDFNIDKSAAQETNINGTERLCRFATNCNELQSFSYISSLYASGLTEGEIKEVRFNPTDGHANFYEWSKWQAEELIINDYATLPWKIIRVGTILCDDKDGTVKQTNAVHNTLKLFYHGLLSVLPGKKDTPLYLTSGEHAAAAILQCIQDPRSHKYYHITHDADNTVSLDQFINRVYSKFKLNDNFNKRMVKKPLYVDLDSFKLLFEGVNDFGGSFIKGAINTVEPFSAQLLINKSVSTFYTNSVINCLDNPNLEQLINNTCDNLIKNKFGVNP